MGPTIHSLIVSRYIGVCICSYASCKIRFGGTQKIIWNCNPSLLLLIHTSLEKNANAIMKGAHLYPIHSFETESAPVSCVPNCVGRFTYISWKIADTQKSKIDSKPSEKWSLWGEQRQKSGAKVGYLFLAFRGSHLIMCTMSTCTHAFLLLWRKILLYVRKKR